MTDDHETRWLDHCAARDRAQIERLRAENEQLHRDLSATLTELAVYKRRCYPSGADVTAAGVTVEKLERWLDAHLEVGDDAMPGRPTPMWSTDGGEDELYPEWREPGSIVPMAIASAIAWCADMMGLDQWALLAEIGGGQQTGAVISDLRVSVAGCPPTVTASFGPSLRLWNGEPVTQETVARLEATHRNYSEALIVLTGTDDGIESGSGSEIVETAIRDVVRRVEQRVAKRIADALEIPPLAEDYDAAMRAVGMVAANLKVERARSP